MKRSGTRGAADFKAVSWDEAIAELAGKLDGLSDRKALAYVTRPAPKPPPGVATEFLTRFGAPAPIGFELFGDEVLRKANALSFGREQLPTFDLSNAMFVVGFGADFLGTWNSPVAQTIAYGQMRQGRAGMRGKFIQIEPRMSLTGANADEWIHARPGTEGVVALGIAHICLLRATPGVGRIRMHPDAVEKVTGCRGEANRTPGARNRRDEAGPGDCRRGAAGTHQRICSTPSRSMRSTRCWPASASRAASGSRPAPCGSSVASVSPTLKDLSAQVLLLDDANPVYGTPKGWGVRDAIAKIPYIASFSSFIDDTSAHADSDPAGSHIPRSDGPTAFRNRDRCWPLPALPVR